MVWLTEGVVLCLFQLKENYFLHDLIQTWHIMKQTKQGFVYCLNIEIQNTESRGSDALWIYFQKNTRNWLMGKIFEKRKSSLNSQQISAKGNSISQNSLSCNSNCSEQCLYSVCQNSCSSKTSPVFSAWPAQSKAPSTIAHMSSQQSVN